MSLQREIYSYSLPPFPLPRFRRTVGAVPPRYALPETVAAEVTEEGGKLKERAGGPKKKERLRLPLSSLSLPSLIHPISHTFLSHLAEYGRGEAAAAPPPKTAIYLSVRPSSCPLVAHNQ